jgi:hypothetical protein
MGLAFREWEANQIIVTHHVRPSQSFQASRNSAGYHRPAKPAGRIAE